MKVSIYVFPYDTDELPNDLFETDNPRVSAEMLVSGITAYTNLGETLVLEDCYTNYEGDELKIVLKGMEPAI